MRLLYFAETPLGMITIKDGSQKCELTIDGHHVGDFDTIYAAVSTVAGCRTGYRPWDRVCPTTRPQKLGDWTRSIF